MAVRGDDRVLRFNAGRDGRDVRDEYGRVVHRRDDDAVDLVGATRLTADQCEFELMVLFDQAGRNDDVRFLDCFRDLLCRDVMRRQLLRINRDVKLARLAAGNAYDRDARQARELWSDDVGGDVCKRRLIAFVGGQAVADDGKDRERESLDVANFRGGRQRRQQLRYARLDQA